MKILIFGAGGMIGHKMFQVLKSKEFQVFGTLKQSRSNYEKFNIFDSQNSFENLDILNGDQVQHVLNEVQPDAILNCIGITLRKPEISNLDYCLKVNSQFPQFLKNWCENNRSYLIHFSTDCVFSGKDGPYSEKSFTSAADIYGRTKALGEVFSDAALILRGSMIGPELFGKTELLEWAFQQKEKSIKGFTKALYSGVTTQVMANLVADLLVVPEKLVGLYQVSSEPISKYDLLTLLNRSFQLNMKIAQDLSVSTEKILSSEKLFRKIAYRCPEWPVMVDELVKENLNSK